MSQYILSSESGLVTRYQQKIQPFWKDKVKISSFDGVGGVSIAYAYVLHLQAKGTVVLSSGRIDCFVKYKEVIFDLYQNGYSVFIHDHRGQGLSGRILEDRHMGYVEDFSNYVADLKTFMDDVVMECSQHQPNLLCHSMGGAIGALTVLRYPELFKKVAFSAPMFGIRPSLPNWFSRFLLNLHSAVNKEVAYFWGQKAYENKPFDNNQLTHSEVRYKIFRQEYQEQAELQLGGVTGDWLSTAIKAMNMIEQQVGNFPIPALVIQAGGDTVVDNKRQASVANKMANSRFMLINNAKHELLEEQDLYRDQAMKGILDFFEY